MQYQRFQNSIIVRIDPNEEIIEQITKIAKKEKITLANISGIGATNHFIIGVYEVLKKQYHSFEYKGNFEILSLNGTITQKENQPYLHLHMSAANDKKEVVGGHLNFASISATCELVIDIINGSINRQFDEITGLNLFSF